MRSFLIVGLLLTGLGAGLAAEVSFELEYTRKLGGLKDAKPTAVEPKEKRLVVDLNGGIAAATLRKKGEGTWPDAVVLRLHTTGLEQFTISVPEQKLSAWVQSHGKFTHFSELNGVQQKADDPQRLKIELKPKAGERAIPHKGFFEITVPAALLKHDELSIQWVDFYR